MFQRLVGMGAAAAVWLPGVAFAQPVSAATSAYAQAVLSDNPTAYYRLDETSGPTLVDAAAVAHSGLYSASGLTFGVPGATGDGDTAISGTGAVQPATVAVNSLPTGNSSFTIEAWFKTTNTADQALADWGAVANQQIVGLAYWHSDYYTGAACSCIVADLYSEALNVGDTTTVGINLVDGKWHLIDLTYDGTAFSGYADGKLVRSGVTPKYGPMNIQPSALRIGYWIDTYFNQWLNGSLDDLAIYSQALPGARVAAHFMATGATAIPPVSCDQAGKLAYNPTSDTKFKWSLTYGISVCEGLVLSHVALEDRLMAERMSLPYLDLVTCTSPLDVTRCTNTTTRHIALRIDSVETQADPTAYTRVHLLDGPVNSFSYTFSGPPCYDRPACNYWTILARYQVDLEPPDATGAFSTYLVITQRYEFYEPFGEKQFQDIACEPSQSTGVAPLATPLPDCGRWKPIVTYHFTDTTSKTLLVSLNAAERLHLTPDAAAVRASALMRDCNNGGPSSNLCAPPIPPIPELLDVYADESAISHEVAIRGLVADPTSSTTLAGRYDNVHQTPSSGVSGPLPIPPGCPECVHMHWKWSDKIGAPAFFGNGKPLICDAILAAQPTGCSSHQQLDVGLVAYHSEALSPGNFMQLINGGDSSPLNMSVVNNQFVGGIAKGTGTLEFPSGGCASRVDLTSWGQCGEVVWLSATSYTNTAHDEDDDVFFAFGGFFCGACGGSSEPNYGAELVGLTPSYMENQHPAHGNKFAVGSTLTISFSGILGQVGKQVNDVLPPGLTGVIAGWVERGTNAQLGTCSLTTDAQNRQVASCNLPPSPTDSFDITIIGTLSAASPGNYSNTIHAIWGSATENSVDGGNYRKSDMIIIV